MSAHCDDCGADLVYGKGENWQLMTCPVCEERAKVKTLRAAVAAVVTQPVYRVEYRNLLGEWHPDLRPFTRTEALAVAGKVRRNIRHSRRDLRRQLRVRVLRGAPERV